MKLLQIYSAKHHPSGNIDMEIRAEVDGEEVDVPFGYRPGDPNGLGPQLDAWWAENQKFPIALADQIDAQPPPTDAQKLDQLFLSVGLTTAAAKALISGK